MGEAVGHPLNFYLETVHTRPVKSFGKAKVSGVCLVFAVFIYLFILFFRLGCFVFETPRDGYFVFEIRCFMLRFSFLTTRSISCIFQGHPTTAQFVGYVFAKP